MKKVDLLREIQVEGLKLTMEEKELFIESLTQAIEKFVGEGESVRLGHLGTFKKKERQERHNPEKKVKLQGVERIIPASVTPAKTVLKFESKIEF